MGERGKDPKEKTCAICGKEIYAGEDWAYKRRIHGERTLWFCSYKHMREYDAKTEPKKKELPAETEPKAPKEPTSRAEQAKALAREILAGRSVIAWLKKEGYKNPHEAYSAVRHYAQTKMPELAETLKPLKDLPKAPQAARTGRPRKYPAKVEPVERLIVDPGKNVPTLEELREIAEMAEAEEPESKDAHLETETIQVDENTMRQVFHFYTREDLLRIVDAAALKCQEDSRMITMSTAGVKAVMFQNANVAARNEGIMRLRKEIRRMLEADDDE